jgi:putative membrane protein
MSLIAARGAYRMAIIPEPPKGAAKVASALKMWMRPFTRVHKIPVFKRVWFYLFALALYTLAVDKIADFIDVPGKVFKEGGTAGAYGSIVLGLLLVFRTNSAYDRWWEGRKLWGQLTNDARNFALKVHSLVETPQPQRVRLGELLISFAFALKHHLRGTSPSEPLPGLRDLPGPLPDHLPLYISKQIYEIIADWSDGRGVDGWKLQMLDPHAKALMDICGSCERIKNSPIAVSYRAFMRQGIALNLLAWPWYLTQEFNVWWTLPPLLIGAYFLIGIELIAEDIEEPFGRDEDDLPLDDICNNIKRTVSSILQIERPKAYTQTIEKPRLDILRDSMLQ